MSTETIAAPLPTSTPTEQPSTTLTNVPPTPPHWSTAFEGLPDEVKGHQSLIPFKNPAEAIKGYVNIQPLIGADKVPIPKDWNNKAEVDAYYTKLGRPESVDKYDLNSAYPENTPDDKKDAALLGEFKNWAFENGLTQKQALALAKQYVDKQLSVSKDHETKTKVDLEVALQNYKKEVGPKFDENIALAHLAMKQYGSPELVEYLNEEGRGNDPKFIKAFTQIGRDLAEDRAHTAGGRLPFTVSGPEAAVAEKIQLQQDEKFMSALQDPSHENHKLAVDKWMKVVGQIPVKNGK